MDTAVTTTSRRRSARRGLVRGLAASAVAATLVTSTVAADTPATPPSTLAPPTVPTPTMPAPTVPGATTSPPPAPTSTPAAPTSAAPPAFTFEELSVPRGIPIEVGGGPQFQAFALLEPADGRDWVMVGDYRSNPGANSQVVVYTAPAASPQSWSITAFSGEEHPMSVRAAVELPDGTVLILGSSDTAGGPVPHTWTFDGTTLSPPAIVGEADRLGRIALATVAADGTVYALIERYASGELIQGELGTRAPDGTWTFSPLPVDARNVVAGGLAANGSTIVMTAGGIPLDSADQRMRAMVFTSVDGGATFAQADTAALASPAVGTQLGNVVVGPDGFYAAACLAGPGGVRSAVARSTDGLTWSEAPFTGWEPVFPIYAGGCADIAVDDEGGVWLAAAQTYLTVVYRVRDGQVDRVTYAEVTGEQAPISTNGAQALRFAVGSGRVVVAVPQSGGPFTGTIGLDATADLETPPPLDEMGMAPTSHEIITELRVINDLGNVVGVETYPHIVGDDDVGYNYQPRLWPFVIGSDGVGVATPDATPVDQVTGAGVDGVVSLPGVDVALTTIAEDVASVGDYAGTLGEIAVSTRPTGGEWSPLEVVAGGPGGQRVRAVAVVGGQVVGVGGEQITDQATTIDRGGALLVVGDGTTFERIDIGSFESAEALSVCALSPTTALVLGYDWGNDRPFAATFDVGTRAVTIVPTVIEPATAIPVRCVAAQGGALVEAITDAGAQLYSTRDGSTYAPLDVLNEDDYVLNTRASAHGVAIVGITGPSDEDAFVLFGRDLTSLQRVEIPSFVGVGIQEVTDIVIDDGMLYAIGTINRSPVVWPIVYS